MRDRRAGGRVVGRQRRQLARRAAQHGVDELVPAAVPALGELDALADDRVRAAAVEERELEEPEPQRRERRRVELGDGPRERLDHVVEGELALDGPVGELHRERPLARVEALAPRRAARGRRRRRARRRAARRRNGRAPARGRDRVRLRSQAVADPQVSHRQAVAAQVGGGVHRAPAGGLDLEQLEAAEQQPAALGAQLARRVRVAHAPRAGRRGTRRRAQRHARADVRRQRAHDAVVDGGGRARVQRAVVGADLLGVRHALLGLLDRARALVERADQQVGAERLQPRGERAVRVVGVDRLAAREVDRARCRSPRSGA